MKIFLVLHHEIMGTSDNWRPDEMVFNTASSMEKALDLIKTSHVSDWSWWEIQVHDLDDHGWPEHVGYFDLRGDRLADPPYKECTELFKKELLRREAADLDKLG